MPECVAQCLIPVCIENKRQVFLVFAWKSTIFKVFNHGFLALNSGVRNFANLPRVELLPPLSMKLLVKVSGSLCTLEIHKRVSKIAFIFEVYRQVEEVVLPRVRAVEQIQHHCLIVFIRYIANHERRSTMFGRSCRAFVGLGLLHIKDELLRVEDSGTVIDDTVLARS